MAGYNVLDVSRYVIDYSNRKEYGISNLKLQKVLYFIQAYFLTNEKNGTPCFRERIEAWDFGPVVPEAYREYRQYGSCNIPTTTSYMDFDVSNIWNSQRRTYAEQKISGGDYSATDLVTLTHKQAPWKKAYVPHMNNEITIESIREYFSAT